jgi:hypothetical protein
MTRQSLRAWLVMAVMAAPVMMPAVANAQPVSIQGRSRSDVTTERRVSDRAFAGSGRLSGNRNQSYGPASRASSGLSLSSRSRAYSPPLRVFRGFSTSRAKQHRAPLVLRHDYRRW